ncbi:molybdenum cofactor guanylyltransferase [Thermovibrio ammonificans]
MCGGRSSRFGADKTLATFNGRPFIEKVLAAATQVAPTYLVSKNPLKFHFLLGRYRFGFVVEGEGVYSPLVGVRAALLQIPARALLFLPADLPFVSPELLRWIVSHPPPVVVKDSNRLHSLVTFLPKAAVTVVDSLLKRGEHRVFRLHRELKTEELPLHLFSHRDYSLKSLTNINRKEEYLETLCR